MATKARTPTTTQIQVLLSPFEESASLGAAATVGVSELEGEGEGNDEGEADDEGEEVAILAVTVAE